MKLIDLLVQELPKRGGWPDNKKYNAFISQDGNGEVWSFPSKPNMNVMRGKWGAPSGDGCYIGLITTIADDFHVSTVTREQYEAALAAAQQPVWDGEGLPPVGCECEALFSKEWQKCEILVHTRFGAIDCAVFKTKSVLDCYPEGHFRPIRSEFDKKRDDAIAKITDAICGEIADTGWATAEKYAARAYDAIARGDIPHIKLSD